MTRLFSILLALAASASLASALPQASRRPARKTAPKPPAATTRAADVTCPQVLGVGIGGRMQFCDVMTGRGPADGIAIHLPPHKGTLTLVFDLHNRHTYSEQEVQSGKGYASYTATVVALAPDSTVLGRGVVQSDFRTARDLLDRVGGGAGPRGVKAVAPLGTERIRVPVPEDVDDVSLIGEKLTVVRYEGTQTFTYTGPSRPIALISNVNVQYVPKAAPKPARRAATPSKRR